MLTPEENELLCRVEGEAPMGQMMRRHWLPAVLSEEVAEPDGTPVRMRLLGEDLVVFRDSKGRLGVLDEHCPHRRASLALGRNEECGLRCLYHGWKIDVDGNVQRDGLGTRRQPLAEKVKHKSYPAREGGGFIWVYMGPRGDHAGIRAAGLGADAGRQISIVKMHVACNWAQVLEGAIDSAHSLEPAFLRHAAGARRRRQGDRRRTGRARRPTSRRGCRCSRRATASATPRSAGRSTMPRRTTTCASRCSSRPSPC